MGEPVVIQQSEAWEEYPDKVLEQTGRLHEVTETGRVTFLRELNSNSNTRMKVLGDTVADASKSAAETLANAKMSDREYAVMLMQNWDPGLPEYIVKAALEYRMSLLKTYSDTRPE